MTDEKKPKWRLRFCGMYDTPALRAAVLHLKTFPLWKDSEAHIIDHNEYLELVQAEDVDEPQSYWKIDKGQVGVVSLRAYSSYTNTWESISTAYQDFKDGWRACEEFMENSSKTINQKAFANVKKIRRKSKAMKQLAPAADLPDDQENLRRLFLYVAREDRR